jgi:predicted nucleic acid-binding protein
VITAVDTNVLIDVFRADPTYGAASRGALRTANQMGALIASEVVWAETVAAFASEEHAAQMLDRLRVRLVPSDLAVASAAGQVWGAYRRTGGRRTRIVSDFLVGAHARVHADQLLTRDRRFYSARFRGLRVVDPMRAG